jgi:hypothetical protein
MVQTRYPKEGLRNCANDEKLVPANPTLRYAFVFLRQKSAFLFAKYHSRLAHKDTHCPGFGESPFGAGDGCDLEGQSLA